MQIASIAPKMLAVYAEKARHKMADKYVGNNIAIFYNSRQEITVIGFNADYPVGTTRKMSEREWSSRGVPDANRS